MGRGKNEIAEATGLVANWNTPGTDSRPLSWAGCNPILSMKVALLTSYKPQAHHRYSLEAPTSCIEQMSEKSRSGVQNTYTHEGSSVNGSDQVGRLCNISATESACNDLPVSGVPHTFMIKGCYVQFLLLICYDTSLLADLCVQSSRVTV